jgi:F-type H+-transporting ATPase subunit b
MNYLLLLAQEHGGHGGGEAEIDPRNLTDHANVAAALWAWAIFIVLVFLLWKFAWGPIAKGLEAREHRISESLKKAEEIEKATRELAETNKAVLAKAQQEAQQLVADARAAAKNAADDVMKKASADVDAQRERFTRETQLAVDKARAELRRDTVELAIQTTAKLLGRTATDADHRRLAEQALRDAESVTRN